MGLTGCVRPQRPVLLRSAISGTMWAGIAILMLMIAGGRFDSVGRLGWALRGGIVAAPFIGIAVGLCWPLFRGARFGGRIVISLVTLYLAAFLFMLAVELTAFAAGAMPQASLPRMVVDSWNVAVIGLTWTGFVVILGPVAFLNHWWISRAGVSRPDRAGQG
jgi:hypothetical protein